MKSFWFTTSHTYRGTYVHTIYYWTHQRKQETSSAQNAPHLCRTATYNKNTLPLCWIEGTCEERRSRMPCVRVCVTHIYTAIYVHVCIVYDGARHRKWMNGKGAGSDATVFKIDCFLFFLLNWITWLHAHCPRQHSGPYLRYSEAYKWLVFNIPIYDLSHSSPYNFGLQTWLYTTSIRRRVIMKKTPVIYNISIYIVHVIHTSQLS